jgi:hypothetical protein
MLEISTDIRNNYARTLSILAPEPRPGTRP